MSLLTENIEKQIRQIFEALEKPVKLVLFTTAETGDSDADCPMCNDTQQLIEEVAALSNKIFVEVLDFREDALAAEQYQVDKVPAIVVLGGEDNKDWGIRLYGIPSGHEFSSLIEDILMASTRKPELRAETMRTLDRLKEPVHIQVYVTPT
jgi:glutaredoxin-like protein